MCNGNNAACTRDENWETVFDGNFVVGIGFTITFTSPQAVEEYLPEGMTPSPLTMNHIDPENTEAKVFGGQVTALKLNVLFSDFGIGLNDPNDPTPLGFLFVGSGPFAGLTVYELLDLGEKVLGGNLNTLNDYNATISQLNSAITSVNENFDNCETDNNFLIKICGTPPYDPGLFCGDGIVNQESEECDGSDGVGEHQICNEFCELENVPYCGDGTVNQASELCDDGNNEAGDSCSSLCQLELDPVCFFPDSLGDSDFDPFGTPSGHEPTLQSIFDSVNYLVDVNADQKQYQVWNFGEQPDVNVTIQFVDSYAGHPSVFGYFLDGNADSFSPLFRIKSNAGLLHPGYPDVNVLLDGQNVMVSFMGGTTLGFAIDSYNPSTGNSRKIFSEKSLNFNSEDRVVVYDVNHYALGFEDLKISGSDNDYQDSVVFFDVLACSDRMFCGDGIVNQESEECDGNDGVPDGYTCNEFCELEQLPFCGDGIVNQESEQCDGEDGVPENYVCTETCELEYVPFCGDGEINQESEVCDDGNNENGDGCSSVCELECIPSFEKTVSEPQFGFCPPEPESEQACFINTDTMINVEITYENELCVDANVHCEWAYNLDGNFFGWFTEFPINFLEESEHELIVQCTDDYGNLINDIETFIVDTTPPETIKSVHEPSSQWTPGENNDPLSLFFPEINELCWADENGIDCWKVTLDTPISMLCEDQQPHPSNNSKIYFMMNLDGDDATQNYCEHYGGVFDEETGWCYSEQLEEFYFLEESEHNLKYFCEDAVGNQSEIDDEKFKVQGNSFEIHLNKKFNLISFPFELKDNNISHVFASVEDEIDSVWTYDAFLGKWFVYRPNMPEASDLDFVMPGMGYVVIALDENVLLLDGSLFLPGQTPPSKNLKEGWNLIGYYGTDGLTSYEGSLGLGRSASCSLYSLGASINDKTWVDLLTYWEPFNPNPWVHFDFSDTLDPGAGYWVNVTENGVYAYSTVCG